MPLLEAGAPLGPGVASAPRNCMKGLVVAVGGFSGSLHVAFFLI